MAIKDDFETITNDARADAENYMARTGGSNGSLGRDDIIASLHFTNVVFVNDYILFWHSVPSVARFVNECCNTLPLQIVSISNLTKYI